MEDSCAWNLRAIFVVMHSYLNHADDVSNWYQSTVTATWISILDEIFASEYIFTVSRSYLSITCTVMYIIHHSKSWRLSMSTFYQFKYSIYCYGIGILAFLSTTLSCSLALKNCRSTLQCRAKLSVCLVFTYWFFAQPTLLYFCNGARMSESGILWILPFLLENMVKITVIGCGLMGIKIAGVSKKYINKATFLFYCSSCAV